MRVVAIDWSGKEKRAAESIWVADVRDGALVDLYNGLDPKKVVARLVELAQAEPQMIVGLDFAFSFPHWWCEQRGWTTAPQVWAAMREEGDTILQDCAPPFWGRVGKPRPHPPELGFRRTDGGGARSVFQICGPGTVGTGSIRGMPILLELAREGFTIWPFSETTWPRVVEIYPRVFTGPVNKSSWRERHKRMFDLFPDHDPRLLERAAGSEDASMRPPPRLSWPATATSCLRLRPLATQSRRSRGKFGAHLITLMWRRDPLLDAYLRLRDEPSNLRVRLDTQAFRFS